MLTIGGERIELSRLLRLSRGNQLAFVTSGGLILAGMVLTLAGIRFKRDSENTLLS